MSTRRKTYGGKVPLSVLVSPRLFDRFRDVAKANHRTMAGELRKLLEDHCAAAELATPATSATKQRSAGRAGNNGSPASPRTDAGG